MYITVVTVCYNAVKQLPKTLESVATQNYEKYQHIIIDGNSTDGTKELLRNYARQHKNVFLISEPDHGIYDAMNKGVRYAEGDYIIFLNAGDIFFKRETLREFAEKAADGKDIYYGDVIFDSSVKNSPHRLRNFDLVWREKMVCHQAIFAKKNLLRSHPFDMQYKMCADRVWLLEVLKKGATYRHLRDYIVSDYDTTGLSSTSRQYYEESLEIGRQYGGTLAVEFICIKRRAGSWLRKLRKL